MADSPWYPVTARTPGQSVEVKWCEVPGCFIFKITEDGQVVDAGGLDNGLRHVAQLFDASAYCVDWSSEVGILFELRRYDAALNPKSPALRRLLAQLVAA